ncbi:MULTISPECIES: hypothetical protein [Providencia]|uniref:hypothetical protein n=1 Tax=Providencia TaxID=586 RepID=UPI00234B8B03|nr:MULTISPECIES: hypothetical protein [Providencia]
MDSKLITEINVQDFTEEIRERMVFLGLPEKVVSRCSKLLLMQLDYVIRNDIENVAKIIHEINFLENNEQGSRTKPATEFKRSVLKGLYHKHYEGTGLETMIININNQLKANKKHYGTELPRLDRYLDEYIEKNPDKNKKFFDKNDFEKIASEYAKEVTSGWSKKAGEQTLTGHWVIFAQYMDKKYYLCISRHTSDDQIIRDKINSSCIEEFPFLKKILS